VYNETDRTLVSTSPDPVVVPVENGVPNFLLLAGANSELNDGAGIASSSDYLDHYAKDAEFFDYFAAPEDPATRHENRRLHEAICRNLPREPSTILDIGCGGAWFAKAATPLGHTVVSFDAAKLNTIRALREVPHPNHFAVTGDANALPFRPESFDTVVSAEVIEHVAKLEPYLNNILRVLKPGGRAIISTPYNEKIQYSLCIHCNCSTPLHAHLRSFKENTLDKYIAGSSGVSISSIVFSSKVLLFLRTHAILKFLPHRLWRFIDSVTNAIIRKPCRLIYILHKER
jgi:SAM-dependent methyltransferase